MSAGWYPNSGGAACAADGHRLSACAGLAASLCWPVRTLRAGPTGETSVILATVQILLIDLY